MKRKFKCLCLILSGIFLVGGLFGLSQKASPIKVRSSQANASEMSSLGSVVITVKSDTRLNENECVITLNNDHLNGAQIDCNYTSIGSKKGEDLYDEYSKFLSFFKNKSSQVRIGKLVKINLTCPDAEKQTIIKGGTPANIKIYFPANLLSKNYAIYVGTAPNSVSFKAVSDSRIKIDNGDVIMDITAYETFYVALVYDGSYIIVWLCVGGFVVILGVCIFFKIRKMRKDDPEYYKSVKDEKKQKKNMRQNMNSQYKNQKQQGNKNYQNSKNYQANNKGKKK